MKTIIRVGAQDVQLAPFGSAMLAAAFDKRRRELPEAVLVVEKSEQGPVYITVGAQPPELAVGSRRVHAVFAPKESQEPVATFFSAIDAQDYGKRRCRKLGYTIREIDATDRVSVHACVAVVIRTPNDRVAYCRIKRTKEWTLPEAELQLGESAHGCAVRAALAFGVGIGATAIPSRVPYVNAYIGELGHFLTLVLVAEVENEVKLELPTSDLYDAVTWASASDPPRPSFVTVQTIRKVLEQTEPELVASSVP